jgi:glycosyltransferase involved in cell wall biosynthesis
VKLLVQHPHSDGEISGVMTSIVQLVPALKMECGVDVRVISSRTASLSEQFAALRWSDAVMLNSNSLWLVLLGRLLGKRTLLKLHFLQYQTVHWKYEKLAFGSRLATELWHLLGLRTNLRYRFDSVARLVVRTVVALTASRVCACSRFCAEQASLPRRVAILLNPLKVTSDLPPRRIQDLDAPPRFMFAGRLTRDKGWDTLLDAAAALRREGLDFQLDIAGDGPDAEALRQRVHVLDLADRVTLVGRLEATELQSRFTGALAAIVPSRFQEPAGYVAVEAASAQVVSIVARVGGLPETAGPYCACFSPGDATELAAQMRRLLSEPVGAIVSGRDAYCRASSEFAPSRVAQDMLALLR